MQQREIYVEEIKTRLHDFDAAFTGLRSRVNHETLEIQLDIADAIAEIISQRELIDREIEQLENTSLERWDQIKTGFEVSWRDIEQCLERIKTELAEKAGARTA
jgi:hypothetical protein